MSHDPALPADETLAQTREHWSRQEIVKTIIHAMVEAGGKVQAVPAGKAADHILAYLAPALSRPSSSGREEVLEEAARAAEAYRAAQGIPAIDYDEACDDIAREIRALKSEPPSTAPAAPQWADNSDPVGDMAIRLASAANEAEEESGEWTWRDVARTALAERKATRPSAPRADSTGRKPGEPFDPAKVIEIGHQLDEEDGGYPSAPINPLSRDHGDTKEPAPNFSTSREQQREAIAREVLDKVSRDEGWGGTDMRFAKQDQPTIVRAMLAFADRLSLGLPAGEGEVVEVLASLAEHADACERMAGHDGPLSEFVPHETLRRARALHDRLTGKDRS